MDRYGHGLDHGGVFKGDSLWEAVQNVMRHCHVFGEGPMLSVVFARNS
jgi:hypothetical protein